MCDPINTYSIRGRTYKLAGPGLEFVFIDLLDKAFDTLEALSECPDSLLRKGRYEQAIESLRSVLSNEEKDAYWTLLSYTIDRNTASK